MTDPLNHSYYAATANPWRPLRSTADDLECDVAVIGGGFTGLSAALACAERGFSVILIEREHVGFGASGRNGGQLIPGLRWTTSEVEAASAPMHCSTCAGATIASKRGSKTMASIAT